MTDKNGIEPRDVGQCKHMAV